MSNYTPKPNTGNAWKNTRQGDEGEYSGSQMDIDGEEYRVVIEPQTEINTKNGPAQGRRIKFVGKQTGFTFSGTVFDQKKNSATEQEEDVAKNRPRYTGLVAGRVNDDLVVKKRVSIWEYTGRNGNPYLSLNIRDWEDRQQEAA
ncbi:hypothetical protein [Microvirga tunisiensis]|uniref:Uncharacterized protein n=1 Tax=Microvirga tunisiensis TaxID=2108360 RepID=A0A5N7MAR7_9HYPH|nr:hypothetical protein [Microvirga tunisiensis]MPR05647.1 hypothetical protein [Microvirga tunisiensis]MPR23847.1 hypothetical protein [Microvirga tunisiensis]